MPLKIYSSLPPGLNRFNAQGQNIGSDHYRRCLKSWKESGFDIVTINSARELECDHQREFDITRITVARDAKDICGKPLVYFSDFINEIERHCDGPIVITNADIEIALSDADKSIITALRPGTFICEHRLDYTANDHTKASLYSAGFDFFVLHKNDLKLFSNSDFVFGMPWWDYFVPVTALAHGLKRIRLDSESRIFHHVHDERWSNEQHEFWARKYWQSIEKLESVLSPYHGLKTLIDRIRSVRSRQSYFPYPRRRNLLPSLLKKSPDNPFHHEVMWLATLSMRMVAKPHEEPLKVLSFSRILNRLPF